MAGFDWNSLPKADEAKPSFDWNAHPVEQPAKPSLQSRYAAGDQSVGFEPDNAPSLLEQGAKATVESLPLAGAVVGGALGAGSTAVPTLGAGAAGGAVVGAALGGAAGKSAENLLKSLFWNDEAPKGAGAALASTAEGAAQGAVTEMGGQVAGAALGGAAKIAANALSSVSKWVGAKTIPLTAKAMKYIGGEDGVVALRELLDKYGITNKPGTLRVVGERLGVVQDGLEKSLGNAYKAIDEAATTQYTGKQYADQIMENLRYLTKDKPLLDAQYETAQAAIAKEFKPEQLYSHVNVIGKARAFEGPYDPALRKLYGKIGMATRITNEELARTAAPTELVDNMREVSTTYSKIRAARDAVDAKLGKAPSAWLDALTALRHTAAFASGHGNVGAASMAYEGSKTALAKTSAASAAKLGADLLSRVADMGPFGKTMLRIAANKGYKGLLDYHEYQMLHNAAYQKAFTSGQNQ